MTISFSDAELDLALQRVEQDHTNARVFVSRAVEWIVLRRDRPSWLARLKERLSSEAYSPSASEIADIPKGGGAVRAGCLLSLQDEVVFAATVGKCLPAIQSVLDWQNPHPDCSYLFRRLDGVEWLSTPFHCWSWFRKRSLDALLPSVNYVVSADVVSFYDYVLHKELLSDLQDAGVESDLAQFLIGALLSRWCLPNGRGLPQGLSASDVLAKLYLNRVDRALDSAGIVHVRYVDDIRIFCPSYAAARKQLLALQRLLRGRGLALQSSKTGILRADKARAHIDGIQPVLAPLAKKFIASIAAAAGIDSAYLSPTDAAELLARLDSPPTDLLQQAYRAYFVDDPKRKFEKTLFHYILTRLGQARDPFALATAIASLGEHPQETSYVLTYIERCGAVLATEAALLGMLSSEEAVYPYQHYQYLNWRARMPDVASDGLLAYARRVAASARAPQYLIGATRLLLSRFGSTVDLDAMKEEYGAAQNEGSRLEIACGVYRMEKTKRNAFLGQAQKDGPLLALAVSAIKSGAFSAAMDAL